MHSKFKNSANHVHRNIHITNCFYDTVCCLLVQKRWTKKKFKFEFLYFGWLHWANYKSTQEWNKPFLFQILYFCFDFRHSKVTSFEFCFIWSFISWISIWMGAEIIESPFFLRFMKKMTIDRCYLYTAFPTLEIPTIFKIQNFIADNFKSCKCNFVCELTDWKKISTTNKNVILKNNNVVHWTDCLFVTFFIHFKLN